MSDPNKTTAEDILHGVAETLEFMLDGPESANPELLAEIATWTVKQLETPQVIEWQRDKATICDKLSELQERMEQIELSGMNYDGVSMVDIFEQPNPVFDERYFRRFILFVQKLIAEPIDPVVFKKAKKVSQNLARDNWIVERREAGDSHKEILYKLQNEHKEWEQLTTTNAISNMLRRRKNDSGGNT